METDIPGSNLTDPQAGPEQAKEMASDKAAAGASAVQPETISDPSQDTTAHASSALIDSKLTDSKLTDDKSSSARPRGRLQSSKLDNTLAELESAFTDWEDLTAKPSTPQGGSTTKAPENEEFKKRTRKLLLQLRQQLREL